MFNIRFLFVGILFCTFTIVNAQSKKANSSGTKGNTSKTSDQETIDNVVDVSKSIQKIGEYEGNNSLADKIEYYEISESCLKNAEFVTSLKLRNQGFTELPSDLSKFKNLKELDLSDNNLKTLTSAISALTNLEVLNLSGNQLSSIPSEICNIKKLKVLNLSSNKITDGSLSCMSSIEHLYLNNNQLTAIPTGVTELNMLRTLSLHSNSITEVSEKLVKLPKLNVLQLQFNKLSLIPEVYKTAKIKLLTIDPQLINNKYEYKFLAVGKFSHSSHSTSLDQPSINIINNNASSGFEQIEDADYNIRSVDIGNGFREIKVNSIDFLRYSKFRLNFWIPFSFIIPFPFPIIIPGTYYLCSKKHRNNIRMSSIYYKQQKITKLALNGSTNANISKANRINKKIVNKYRRVLKSKKTISN